MSFVVGSRVKDADGYKATVRYIGPVAAAKNKEEVWLGVEWDDSNRGKHDGSCLNDEGKIVRYFSCAFGAGSFVKLGKIVPGRSLVEALRDRYVDLDAPSVARDSTLPDAFFNTSKGNQKSIEFVGEDKIRRRQQLSAIDKFAVRSDNVAFSGDGLLELAGHMVEADLQDNLLWSWIEVSKLGLCMPQLQKLLLHGNRMEKLTPEILIDFPRDCFRSLTVLALNACNISSWAEVQLMDAFLPALEELYLADNSLTDLPESDSATTEHPVVSGFGRLRVLDISRCGLVNWLQLHSFGHLPSLQEMVLDGNTRLTQVAPCPADQFASLVRISLSSTGLAAWSDMDTLATYPVQVLRITSIPLFEGKGASEVRPLVIARIPRLQVLNASRVSPREREDSEKVYIRAALREKEALAADKSEEDIMRVFSVIHPRFRELFERYGHEAMAAVKATAGASLASELISITFNNLSFGSNGSLEPVTKKIPRTMTVGKVKLLVRQLYGLEPRLQHLSLRVYKDSVPTFLDDELSSLGYFGAIEGAQIYINEDKA